MAKRTCAQCGDDISHLHANRRYCSTQCKWRGAPRLPCSACGGPTGWRAGRTDIDSATCNDCRRTRWEHGTRKGYGTHKCRCEECRAWQAAAMRTYQASLRLRGVARKVYRYTETRTCQLCGKDFETRADSPTRFCSVSCSKTKVRSRELVHVGPVVPKDAPPTPITVVTGPKWWAVIVQGPCAWCGAQFTAASGSACYCSTRCSKNAYYEKRGSKFTIPPRIRRAIYERDNWTCQLCMEPIDREAHYLDDWAPTLDHITPQSHMLIPDHSPANLRTAHRWCNSVRGDGTWHADFFEEAS